MHGVNTMTTTTDLYISILLITQVHEIIVFILLHEKFCNLIGFLHGENYKPFVGSSVNK